MESEEELKGIPYWDVDDDELTDEQILEKYEPNVLGPVWKKDENGKWLLPAPNRTLGWQVVEWCGRWLNPLGEDQKIFTFTLEQLRFVLWWYAIDGEGKFVYESAVLQRIKGWGKDPLIAVLSLVEAFGPCRFDRWNSQGFPIAKRCPQGWVQVFALSKEQTTNTFAMFPTLISERLKKHADIDDGVELIRGLRKTARIEAKTSSWRAAEGGRPTFLVLNETQHFLTSNNGKQLAQTSRGNATKRGRHIAITNAFKPGEDSVAQGDRENYDGIVEGARADNRMLYDSIEAPAHTPLTERVFKIIYKVVRGDSVWCDPDKTWLLVLDKNRPTSESRRMFLNQINQPEGSLYKAEEWDRIKVSNTLRPGDRICLGFDGGKSDDATALVAIRIRDGLIVPLCLEEKPLDSPDDDWEVNRARVDSAVHRAFRDYNVAAFFADVNLWESHIHDWGLDYGHNLVVRASADNPVAFDMRGSKKRMAAIHERFMSAILEQHVKHGVDPYGQSLDQAFRRHVLNAVRRDTSYGVSFMKESPESPKKVDMYAAAMLAFTAMQEVQQHEALKPAYVPSPVVVDRY